VVSPSRPRDHRHTDDYWTIDNAPKGGGVRIRIDGSTLTPRFGAVGGVEGGVSTADYLAARRACVVAHACRDAKVVCGRVELTVATDTRLGLTARERRRFTVRFLDGVETGLHAELTQLVRRRGAVAHRAAERMEPIEIVFDDRLHGLQRIVGAVQPPQQRNGDLHDIRFGLRQAAAP
jgi:hypothetical protein